MINLRFHIVSITAVFLSLAIGIFMGTSLLNGATVERLKDRQSSLQEKIAARESENEQFRGAFDVVQADDDALESLVTPALVRGIVPAPVLVIANRGVNEDVIAKLRSLIDLGGATSYGTIWLDDRTDLSNTEAAAAVEAALGVDQVGSATSRRADVIAEMASTITGTAPASSDLTTTSTPPTTVDPGETVDPAVTTTSVPDPNSPVQSNLRVWEALRTAELIDWEGGPADGSFPTNGIRTIIISGEGAKVDAGAVLLPLIDAVARERRGTLVVAETMNPLPAVDDALRSLDKAAPARGRFIGAVRRDAVVRDRISTVDDLDRPTGRLAVMLSLAALPDVTGDYGIVGDTDGPYPSPQ